MDLKRALRRFWMDFGLGPGKGFSGFFIVALVMKLLMWTSELIG